MKRLLILVVVSIVVGVLAFFGYKMVTNSGSTVDSMLIEFAIPETEKIDRIVITDAHGRVMDLRKNTKDTLWTGNNGSCVGQEGIQYILDACRKIEFKGYLPENAVPTEEKILATQHTKVEYYLNGKWHKTWYIGSPSKDHLGQVMLLDSKELGKSNKPVIMTIKGMHGIIEPRFYADPLKWQCTKVFGVMARDIKKVDVSYLQEPVRSFSVESVEGSKFVVKQQNIPLPAVDTQFVMLYLNKFKNIHFDMPNYVLTDSEIEDVKRSSPFCVLTLDLKDGKRERVRMFRIPTDITHVNEFGQPVNYEVDRFWAELTSGELVKCQYFVFDPLTLGHLYFPLDLSSLDLNGYEVKAPGSYRN